VLRHIEQDGRNSCGLAAIAMSFGLASCDEARTILGRDPETEHPGVGRITVWAEEFARLLFESGVPALPVYSPEWYGPGWERAALTRMATVADAVAHIERGGAAILGVARKGAGHWVVVQDCTIFDPSPALRYAWGEPIPLVMAVLIDARLPVRPGGVGSLARPDCEAGREPFQLGPLPPKPDGARETPRECLSLKDNRS
jgi:hypothetical protein